MDYEYDTHAAATGGGDGASVFDGFSKALLGVVELFDEPQQAPQQRRRPATDAASVVKSAAETPASASSIKGRKGKLVQPRVSQTDDMLSHDTGSSARTTVSSSGAFSPQQAIAQPAVPHSPAQDMTASTIRSGQSAQSKGLLESFIWGISGLGSKATDLLDRIDAQFENIFHPDHLNPETSQQSGTAPTQLPALGVLHLRSGGPSPGAASRTGGLVKSGGTAGSRPRLNAKLQSSSGGASKTAATGTVTSPRISTTPSKGAASPNATTPTKQPAAASGTNNTQDGAVPSRASVASLDIDVSSPSGQVGGNSNKASAVGPVAEGRGAAAVRDQAKAKSNDPSTTSAPTAAAAAGEQATAHAQAAPTASDAPAAAAPVQAGSAGAGACGAPGCADCVINRKRLAAARRKNQELEADNKRLLTGSGGDPVLCQQLERLLEEKARLVLDNCRLQREVAGLQQLLAYTWEHQVALQDAMQDEDGWEHVLHDTVPGAAASPQLRSPNAAAAVAAAAAAAAGSQGSAGATPSPARRGGAAAHGAAGAAHVPREWGDAGMWCGDVCGPAPASDTLACMARRHAAAADDHTHEGDGEDATALAAHSMRMHGAPSADFVRQLETLFGPDSTHGPAAGDAAAAAGASATPAAVPAGTAAATPMTAGSVGADHDLHEEVRDLARHYSTLLSSLPSPAPPDVLSSGAAEQPDETAAQAAAAAAATASEDAPGAASGSELHDTAAEPQPPLPQAPVPQSPQHGAPQSPSAATPHQPHSPPAKSAKGSPPSPSKQSLSPTKRSPGKGSPGQADRRRMSCDVPGVSSAKGSPGKADGPGSSGLQQGEGDQDQVCGLVLASCASEGHTCESGEATQEGVTPKVAALSM